MSQNKQDKITAFDTLFTNNHIQKLKILLSLFDTPVQKKMAVYIKYLELQYTLSLCLGKTSLPLPCQEEKNPVLLCQELFPYCDQSERDRLSHLQNTLQTFENYQEMMETVREMSELFPEGDNPLDSLLGGMDPSQIFAMFHQGEEPEKET